MLVMDSIFGVAGNAAGSHMGGGDSFVDRLNCRYTVMLLAAFSLLITTKHYVKDPINCWCPAHFKPSHVDFTNSVSKPKLTIVWFSEYNIKSKH